MTITLRPYHRDKTRIQVDIMIAHPATDEPIRTRPVAPKGMDEAAARVWAEKKVQEINRKLFREASKAEEQHKQAVATDNKSTNSKKCHKKAAPKPDESCPTLAELWDRYYTEVLSDREQTRRTTAVCYEKVWRSIEARVGKIRCDAWTKDDSKRLAAQFADASPRHANRVNTVVSNLFKIAIEDEHIEDPPRFIRRKVKKTLKPAAHNRDDLELLLAAARELDIETGESMEVILLLGVDAGLRPGEVAGLRWSDVDWNANHVLIQNQRPMPMPEDEEYPVKYDEVGRLTMTTRLRKAIERRHARGDAKRYVCVTASGDALHTHTVSDRVYRIHERAGLPLKKRGHFLRLCAASRVAHHPKAGVADAQGLLRHKNMTTTEIYLQEIRGTDTSRRAAAILNLVEEEETGTALAPAGTEPQFSRSLPN
ncbi:tyrosine-type recombinase/integrase [Nannocystis pusilla]|uniref:Site-specific integrase n=1 Tax=Nannocystis pusilla TaxID=889268 RepID=A0ABS7TN68_9BACT|nr:site-specific integrase [Nannocystis pusilla]